MQEFTERMPGGFFIYHADDQEELLYLNSAVLRIFGCTSLEEFKALTGCTFKGMVHPDDITAVEQTIQEQIRCSQYDLDYVEYRIIQKDGSIRWVEDYGHFLHTEAYGDIFYVFIEDATERLRSRMAQLEEANTALRDSYVRESTALQQAQSAIIARNSFLFHMSHDLKTPLNAIIGYTELLKLHKAEPDKIEDYLNKLSLSSHQLLSIVNEALEITRMESGRVELIECEYFLPELLLEIEKGLLPLAQAKSITFTIQHSRVQHQHLIGDTIRIKEILHQLLDNAIKYTSTNGHVSLTVIENDVRLKNRAQFRFIIEDDGSGISKEFMHTLFDPFQREKNTTRSGILGTGLGLTVVKNLVDMMEGTIEVESQPGKGSRFTITLLLRYHEHSSSDSVSEPASRVSLDSLKGKRILLAEDNELNCEIAEELLQSQGYVVDTVYNGRMALEQLQQSPPGYYALILMDIQMPVMDGYEAARAIRKLSDPDLARIPIIALSANTFAEDYKRSLEAGMNTHFPKPIDIAALQETIQNILSQ